MIESVIEQITQARSPGSGNNLLGFRIDAEELLGRASESLNERCAILVLGDAHAPLGHHGRQ